MADVELLPLPEGEAIGWTQAWSYDQMRSYARANVAHATASKEAEIERLAEALRKLEEREQRDEALLREALYALEYSSGMTRPEDLQGCGCPICTSIAALRERLGKGVEQKA